MPRQPLLKDEQIIYDSMKAIRGIPQSKIEFMLKKVGGPFAGTFRLSGPWGNRYFFIKAVPKLTPELLELVIHQIRTTPAPGDASPLLVSSYISPKLAAQLKAKGDRVRRLRWQPLSEPDAALHRNHRTETHPQNSRCG